MRVLTERESFMRKFILIAARLLIAVSLSSCDMINEWFYDEDESVGDATIGDKADGGDGYTYDGALITLVSSTSDSLTVIIENNSDSTWQSGNMRDYRLQTERDGEWYEVTQIGELANTMELMLITPGQSLEHTFTFANRYGNLTPGKYRVVKSFWANATATAEACEFRLICEFTVE